MSANKLLAATLIATVLVPSFAVAQSSVPVVSTGPDLIPLKLDVIGAVVGVSTTLTVTIANQGSAECCAQSGWQVVFGRAADETTCFADPTAAYATSKCIVRFAPGTAGASLGKGLTTDVSLTGWFPNTADAGNGKIFVWITPIGCDATTRSGVGTGLSQCGYTSDPPPYGSYSGPDTGNEANDVKSFPLFVKNPGVRAEPIRVVSPSPGKKLNDPYEFVDIVSDCKAPPETNDVGCKTLPGQLVRFSYKIVNAGNAQDTFLAKVIDNAGSSNAPNLTGRGYKWAFAPWHVTIPSLSSTTVDLEVIVPLTEYLNNNTNVNGSATSAIHVEWASESNSAITTAHPSDAVCGAQLQSQELCADPTWPSILIGAQRGLRATSNDTIRMANHTSTGQPVTFNITINNTGNAPDRFSIVMDNASTQVNASWQGNYPAYVDLAPQQNATIEMAFTPPGNATKGYHHFDITVASLNESRARQSLHFVADLQQWFQVHGALNANVIQVVPAESAEYVLFVHNDGNGPDNATIDMRNEPFGWKVALSSRVVPMAAGATVPVYLNVTPPMNTAAGTAASVFLNVTSQGPPEKIPTERSTFSTNATINVIAGPNLDVTTPTPKSFVDPGSTTGFDIAVRNTGNVVDNFTVSLERSQDQLAWITTFDPPFLVLAPTLAGSVHVTLKAPASGAVGETTKVFVTVNSSVNAARFRQITLEGEVSGPDVFVESVALNGTNPYSGDPVELNIVLGNAGNKAPEKNVTLKTYFVQNGVPRPVGEKTYPLTELPGGRRLTERIAWDTTGIEGTGILLARIDEDKSVPEIDETNNEASRALILRTFDFHVTAAEPLSGHPGEKLSYNAAPHAFTIRYDGNQATENVSVIIDSEHGWGHTEQTIPLTKGTTFPVYVDVSIPASPGVATDTLTFRVIPQLRPNAEITAQVTTTVIDENAPKILSVTALPASVKIGEPVTIRAEVSDETGLKSVRAFLVTPTNDTQTLLLDPVGNGAFQHTQPYNVAGAFRLYVEAIDGSVNANKNSSRDTVVSFNVTPGSAPVIKLADGQVTTVRTGALVRLNITDPLGVGEVTYALKGATYSLQRPFSIDTAELKEGSYDITVTAANIYGVRSTAKVALTVDDTPPTIRSVTLDPGAPKANENAKLRVETDANVENVTITIKKGEQIVQTAPAKKASAGTFELTISPAEGSYTIDVAAKDLAGNEQISKGAVSFTAKPAGVPGPGLGVLIYTLALLAIAVRRRR